VSSCSYIIAETVSILFTTETGNDSNTILKYLGKIMPESNINGTKE